MSSPFVDRERAQQYELVDARASVRFADARKKVHPEVGAAWIEVNGTTAIYDGIHSPITQTFGLGFEEGKLSETLDQIEPFFREHGAATNHEVCVMAGMEPLQELARRGYVPIEQSIVQHRLIEPFPDQPSTVDVKIIGPSEIDIWVEVMTAGFGEYPEFADVLRGIGQVSARKEGCICFLASIDGKPVAAATLNWEGDIASLSGACTVPEARCKGAHSALISARMRHADSMGCKTVLVVATPGSASHKNAERLGFKQAYTRIKWQLE